MSQEIKLELPDRIRAFRQRARLSQDELGERLGVSGNYISMIELSKKAPGPSLAKLFELLELSPLYSSRGLGEATTSVSGPLPANPLWAMLSTETLMQSFGEVAGKLAAGSAVEQKRVIGNLRELLDEIELRLLVNSGGLSEAQQIAVKAAQSGANPEIK